MDKKIGYKPSARRGLFRLLMVLFLLIFNGNIVAAAFEVDGIKYYVEGDYKVSVVGKSKQMSSLNIPETVQYGNITYRVGEIAETAFENCTDIVSVSIPKTIQFVGLDAFAGCTSLNKVIVSDIAAFCNIEFEKADDSDGNPIGLAHHLYKDENTEYTELVIPETVKSIPEVHFYQCYSFTSIVLPNSITSLGFGAFSGCKNVKSVTLSNSLTNIPSQAFYDCNSLESLELPDGITSIGALAFSGCKNVRTVIFSNSLTTIQPLAFQDCTSLESIELPDGVQKIGYAAFKGCTNLSSVVLPNSLSSLTLNIDYRNKGGAFENCSKLSYVKSHIESPFNISSNTFKNISSTAVLEVPKGTKEQYQTCSGWADCFKDIIEEGAPTTYVLSITVSGNGSATFDGTAVRSNTSTFEVNEGTSVSITLTPDEGNRIKSIEVNNTDVTSSISNNTYAISNISNDISVEVKFEAIPPTTYTLSIKATGNGTISYGDNSVKGKTSTFSVNEGTSVTITLTPDDGYRVKSLKVNNTDVTSSISDNQYNISNISASTSIEAEFEAIPPTTYTLSIKATGNGSVSYGETSVKGKTSTFTVNEGTSVTITLSPNDGYRVKSLTVNNADVTSSITDNQYTISSINADMNVEVEFEACYIKFNVDGINYILDTEKKEVEVTNSVNSYNEWIGYDGDIVVPSTVVYQGVSYDVVGIGNNAFREEEQDWNYSPWSQLNSVTISEGIKYIGSSAFSDCVVLKKVVLPSTIVSIGQYAFKECRQLESIEIPCSVKNIEDGTFYFCKGLKSVKMGDIESIGISAFGICSSLESFTIPGTTTSIGARAFADCSSLSLVESHINEPFQISENTFSNISTTAKIQVPKGTKQKYEAYVGWTKYFKEIKEKGVTTTYVLSITISGNGSATYDGTVVRSNTSSFTVDEGANVTITFTPDEGYKTKSVKVNNTEVTSSVSNNTYTISNISNDTSVEVEFEAIPPTTYTLSIKATGNGTVSYGNTSVKGKTSTFTVNEGTSVTITLTPDNGYRVKSLTVNNTDVKASISNNQYTISSINANTSVVAEFEAIPPTTYTLSIKATGNGTVSYGDASVKGKTSTFTVNEGTSVTITLTPDDGYRVKSLIVNNTDVTSSISNNQYTISSINANTSIVAEFEVIPPTTYTLSIKASGNGSVKYGDTSVRIGTNTFTVIEGTSADLIIIPDEAHLLKSFVINNTDVTSKIVGNKYTISNVNSDITVEVEFKAIETLTYDGMEFKVSSTEQKEVVVANSDYGLWIEVPETVSAYELTWTVTGFEDGAFESATGLAAVIWNPQVKFKEKVTNPNLLLYVKSADYAPTEVKNVIVNGKARSITLNDAESDNNFYCPQEFTAENITYEHNYSMKTGYSTCQGWETIVLPFDVAVVTNNIGTELVPYPLWTLGESKRPFWLCSMNEDGWKDESAIKANTPYIISMPNNDNYDATYNISGNIVFSASNVTVQESNNLVSSKHGHRNLVPNYQNRDSSPEVYALNVNNLWDQNTDSDLAEGSAFIRDSRQVRPFEAYMTIDSSGGTTRSISIFGDDDTTGIKNLPLARKHNDGTIRVYSVSGILIKQGTDERILNELPKGIYVVNGKKIIK